MALDEQWFPPRLLVLAGFRKPASPVVTVDLWLVTCVFSCLFKWGVRSSFWKGAFLGFQGAWCRGGRAGDDRDFLCCLLGRLCVVTAPEAAITVGAAVCLSGSMCIFNNHLLESQVVTKVQGPEAAGLCSQPGTG